MFVSISGTSFFLHAFYYVVLRVLAVGARLMLLHGTCHHMGSAGNVLMCMCATICFNCNFFPVFLSFFQRLAATPNGNVSMTLKCMKLILLHGNRCGAFRSSFWSSCCLMCSHRFGKCCECDKYANKQAICWRISA